MYELISITTVYPRRNITKYSWGLWEKSLIFMCDYWPLFTVQTETQTAADPGLLDHNNIVYTLVQDYAFTWMK